MTQTNVQGTFPQHEQNDEIRESLTTIRRERSRKLVFAVGSLVVLLLLGGLAVYLMYSSEPGTMKLDTSGQHGRGAR